MAQQDGFSPGSCAAVRLTTSGSPPAPPTPLMSRMRQSLSLPGPGPGSCK